MNYLKWYILKSVFIVADHSGVNLSHGKLVKSQTKENCSFQFNWTYSHYSEWDTRKCDPLHISDISDMISLIYVQSSSKDWPSKDWHILRNFSKFWKN